MKQITLSDMQQQSEAAASAPRLRAHRNFHPELSDPVQRLAIAMEPGTYIRPHRHRHTFELLLPLKGRFVVLNFDDNGVVTRRVVLGETCTALEMEAGNGEEENVRLRFTDIKDFEPEQVARQIPQLRAMLAMRNLLRDLKSNLLDNATFRKELEAILKDPAQSQELRDEMSALAPK